MHMYAVSRRELLLLDIVDHEINTLAQNANGLGRVFAGSIWL